MKILKIFFVGVGLIIGLLLSASIGVAFDNFLQLKYTPNFENYWSEFRDIQNLKLQYEIEQYPNLQFY